MGLMLTIQVVLAISAIVSIIIGSMFTAKVIWICAMLLMVVMVSVEYYFECKYEYESKNK